MSKFQKPECQSRQKQGESQIKEKTDEQPKPTDEQRNSKVTVGHMQRDRLEERPGCDDFQEELRRTSLVTEYQDSVRLCAAKKVRKGLEHFLADGDFGDMFLLASVLESWKALDVDDRWRSGGLAAAFAEVIGIEDPSKPDTLPSN